MRPAISLLLLAALSIGGCNKQPAAGSQASETIQPSEPISANVTETVVEETIGTLDRGHKGEAAPTTPFQNPAGATVTLASFAGKPVLLNLWATWCAPCVKEMPTLEALAQSLGDSVQVITLSQDTDRSVGQVVPFLQKGHFTKLQPYLDTQTAMSVGLNVNLPTTILYDSQGKEVWRMAGGMDWTQQTARELVAEAK